MPGDNCVFNNCNVSRHKKFRGISLFKVPSGSSDFDKSWREKLLAVVKTYRVVDESLQRQISTGKIFICQRHFHENEYHRHDSGKATLNPGVIPTQNLPQKSHSSSATSSTRRNSAETIIAKKVIHAACSENSNQNNYNENCYKSFDHFKSRLHTLKLHSWKYQEHENHILFTCADDIHYVPKV